MNKNAKPQGEHSSAESLSLRSPEARGRWRSRRTGPWRAGTYTAAGTAAGATGEGGHRGVSWRALACLGSGGRWHGASILLRRRRACFHGASVALKAMMRGRSDADTRPTGVLSEARAALSREVEMPEAAMPTAMPA